MLSWNINGLGPIKLDLHDTDNTWHSFTSSSFLKQGQLRSLSFQNMRDSSCPHLGLEQGARVCVCLFTQLLPTVCASGTSSSSSALWIVLSSAVSGLAHDIYIAAVYVLPAQSALLRTVSAAARFTELMEDASAASSLGSVLMMGDFNARIADRPDADSHSSAKLQAQGLVSHAWLH